jgi:hypothetical protein
MKFYNAPTVEIVELNVADIITLSAPDELAGNDDTAVAPDSWFN